MSKCPLFYVDLLLSISFKSNIVNGAMEESVGEGNQLFIKCVIFKRKSLNVYLCFLS
jgi:hypothetical protein